MRILSTFLLIVFSLTLAAKSKEVLRHWNVTSASYLQIEGTTNINTFQCGSVYESGNDMIRERWDPYNEKWEIFGSIHLEVDNFDCQNRVMNNDFKNTLDYSNHPEIRVEFIDLKERRTMGNTRMAEGWVAITIVGKTRKYHIKSELELLDDHYSILRGKQIFTFSDFGLTPPQKGLGLVRVDDKLTVSFELILEQSALTGN